VATKETIAKAVTLITENWADREMNYAVTLRLYQQILSDLPDEAIEAAVMQRIGDDNPFPPRVGEIRQLAIDIVSGADEVMSAQEAWGKLLRWIRRYGGGIPRWDSHGPVTPPALPPIVKKAADAIGGTAFISMSENPAADRARFIEAYNTFVKRERARIGMLPQVREARQALSGQRAAMLGDGQTATAHEHVPEAVID